MRDLTKAELEEYFQFAREDKAAADFHMDQTQLIGQVAIDTEAADVIMKKLRVALQTVGVKERDALLSLWVAAFQMGRECESRLITAALKGMRQTAER